MARFLHYEPCEKCRANGRDRRGDNFGRYSDGGGHCWSCGHHEHPKGLQRLQQQEPVNGNEGQDTLPRDFTREVPAVGWKWLLQYGLPYSYWKEFTGYSPSTNRLILTHGQPVELSVGRYIGPNDGEGTGEPPRKWRQWGDKLRSAHVLEPPNAGSYEGIVLVEDLISAHKVGRVAKALPLFGTMVYPRVIATLRALKRPVTLWLDADQYTLLPPKINRLQTFLDVPVRFVKTEKDPKAMSLEDIDWILK